MGMFWSSSLYPAGTRPLTPHDRFFVCRRNVGHPPSIVFLLRYPSPSSLPNTADLLDRIALLQDHFPLLHAVVRDGTKTKPFWVVRDPWPPEDILRDATYRTEQSIGEVLEAEIRRMNGQDPTTRPMWQVSRLFAASTSSNELNEKEEAAYLALSAQHELVDGRGALQLLTYLLAPESGVRGLPVEDLHLPTVAETIPTKPSWAYLGGLIFREVIRPLLPKWIQGYFPVVRPWPTQPVAAAPVDVDFGVSVLSIPSETVARLKVAAREEGVRTLHPVLKVAYMASIWAHARRSNSLKDIEGQEPTIRGNTPRSERQPEQLGHPRCTGNYTSSYEVDMSFEPTDDFWHRASGMAAKLVDPKEIQKARWQMHMLNYLPDGQLDGRSSSGGVGATQWEEYFLAQARGPRPFRSTVNVSNLGMYALPDGADDMVWGVDPSVFGPVFGVSVLGHRGGLRVITSWREGSAVDRDGVKWVEGAFVRLLEGLVSGDSRRTLKQLLDLT